MHFIKKNINNWKIKYESEFLIAIVKMFRIDKKKLHVD